MGSTPPKQGGRTGEVPLIKLSTRRLVIWGIVHTGLVVVVMLGVFAFPPPRGVIPVVYLIWLLPVVLVALTILPLAISEARWLAGGAVLVKARGDNVVRIERSRFGTPTEVPVVTCSEGHSPTWC